MFVKYTSFIVRFFAELVFLEEIGRGGFGRVSKVVWRGSIVAAKEIPTAGNSRILENELAVYRYTLFLATLPQAIFSYP